MIEPRFDPLHYATAVMYGRYTRSRAATAAYDAGLIDQATLIELFELIWVR